VKPCVQALNVGVVVPQFMAGQDRWWAPHMGRLPGADKTPLPYRAPLDHILDLEHGLGRRKDEATHGPNVPFREHSFLQNPRMPAHVRDSAVVVEVCPEGNNAACADGSAPAGVSDGVVRLRAGLTDKQIAAALGDVAAEFKVLRFRNVTGVFSRHEERADEQRFHTRMRLLGSLWCCMRPPPGKPGHVWYDALWDIVPHKDVHNRKWREPWHIQMGP
jgi:arabinosyltransferase